MKFEDILSLPITEAWEKLTDKPERKVEFDTIEKQLDPYQHDVMDATIRPRKTVKKFVGNDKDGKPMYEDRQEEVNRIALPLQELIVNRAVGFLLGNPVKLRSNAGDEKAEELFGMVRKIWKDAKIDYFNRDLTRTLFSETEVAELWFLTTDEEYWQKPGITIRPKVKLLKPSEGNKLIPLWDEYDDMIAFSREYTVTRDDKKVTILETYTKDLILKFEKSGDDDPILVLREKNLLGKIPVIYYSQDYPEWYKVQIVIDRLETLLSNFGDTNDYFGSPIVAAYGKVLGFSDKGEQGKVVQVEKDGKVEYLSWQHAPDSVKLEIETLFEIAYTLTQTPNISFSQMKGLGNLSGVALKLMFMDAHMKVENKIEILGEMFQRRINLMKSICALANISLADARPSLEVEPIFRPYMPRNEKEEMEVLTTATSGKPVMSQQTAIENNSFINDPDEELERINEEVKETATREQYSW